MRYYPELYKRIRNKKKKDQSSYATRKELDHVADVDTSDLAAKKNLLL